MQIYTSAIRILEKGYLPNTLVTPSKLQVILNEVRKALWTTNPNYDLVIDRQRLYYDMKLVTFGIDKNKKSDYTIPSIHTTIYATATNIIPTGNSICSNYWPEHTSTFLHTFTI